MSLLRRKIKAKYIGPDHPRYGKDEEFEIIVVTQGTSPEMEIVSHEGATSVRYPSKKKFLEHWQPEDKWERSATIIKLAPGRGKRPKPTDISVADAGAVIYTEVIAAINRFNKKSETTYADNPAKKPEFTVRLEKQVYPEETQEQTGLYGAGVLIMEVKQYAMRRIIYQEGISFKTERELDNVNSYAPKMYIQLMDSLVESALLYILALNPDDPENVNAIKDAEKETPTAPPISE